MKKPKEIELSPLFDKIISKTSENSKIRISQMIEENKTNMKNKEEIEQLANQYIEDNTGDHYVYCGFVEGYTQCQEDNKDKKYSEEELLDAMSFAECYIIEHDKPLFLKSNGKPVPDCLEYIKLLNKQD